MQVTSTKKKMIITIVVTLFFLIAILLSTVFMSRELDLYFPSLGTGYEDVQLLIKDDSLVDLVFVHAYRTK